MKVTLLVIGKTDAEYLKKGIDIYKKRLGNYINFEIVVIPDKKFSAKKEKLPVKEYSRIVTSIGPGKQLCVLDEKGKELTSKEFAGFIEQRINSGLKELIFFIGGPYGFPEEITDMATSLISLSKMTFSHQLVRLLFLEQLYRAFTIIKGESYHHD